MDFFSWQNMHNARLTASTTPLKNLTVSVDYHLFWLASTDDYFYSVAGAARRSGGYGIRPENNSFAGSELDLIATYRLRKLGLLQAGYGHFFRGDYVRQSLSAAGSQDADWVYVQAVLNF
jgi:hypothetical protein